MYINYSSLRIVWEAVSYVPPHIRKMILWWNFDRTEPNTHQTSALPAFLSEMTKAQFDQAVGHTLLWKSISEHLWIGGFLRKLVFCLARRLNVIWGSAYQRNQSPFLAEVRQASRIVFGYAQVSWFSCCSLCHVAISGKYECMDYYDQHMRFVLKTSSANSAIWPGWTVHLLM